MITYFSMETSYLPNLKFEKSVLYYLKQLYFNVLSGTKPRIENKVEKQTLVCIAQKIFNNYIQIL